MIVCQQDAGPTHARYCTPSGYGTCASFLFDVPRQHSLEDTSRTGRQTMQNRHRPSDSLHGVRNVEGPRRALRCRPIGQLIWAQAYDNDTRTPMCSRSPGMSDPARRRLRCGSVGASKSVGAPKTVQSQLTLPGSPRAGPPKVPGYRLALVLSALLCCSTPSLAQTTAMLQGRVFDPSGAIIAGASITVRNQSTGFVLSVSTDGRGRYLIAAIPAGLYEVTAASAGFHSERHRRSDLRGRPDAGARLPPGGG